MLGFLGACPTPFAHSRTPFAKAKATRGSRRPLWALPARAHLPPRVLRPPLLCAPPRKIPAQSPQCHLRSRRLIPCTGGQGHPRFSLHTSRSVSSLVLVVSGDWWCRGLALRRPPVPRLPRALPAKARLPAQVPCSKPLYLPPVKLCA